MIGGKNIFAVADDDQSIYAFRGARPSILFDFERHSAGCKRYLLEENYRSLKEITSLASLFIMRNSVRFEKNIYTGNGPGGNIEVKGFPDMQRQTCFVTDKIKECLAEKMSVCVLYRNNISSLCIAAKLCADSVRRGRRLEDATVRDENTSAAVLPL